MIIGSFQIYLSNPNFVCCVRHVHFRWILKLVKVLTDSTFKFQIQDVGNIAIWFLNRMSVLPLTLFFFFQSITSTITAVARVKNTYCIPTPPTHPQKRRIKRQSVFAVQLIPYSPLNALMQWRNQLYKREWTILWLRRIHHQWSIVDL